MLSRCLLCMRMFRGAGRYCGPACEARCAPSPQQEAAKQRIERPSDAMRPAEALRTAGITLRELKALCSSGQLRAWSVGRRWWVDRGQFMAWLEARE